MTSVKPPMEETVKPAETASGRRPWITAVVVLGVALVALAGWAIYDQVSGDSVPDDIQQLLDEYQAAWADKDEAALRATLTDSFVMNQFIYIDFRAGNRQGAYLHDRRENIDVDRITRTGFQSDYRIDQVGSATITGENPWILYVGENWTWLGTQWVGDATYVFVEQDGQLKIDNHYWAGLQTSLDN